ncbi:conserved membrane protein of unknown function [Candidatus Hydrogenisulfobacillus filiaventi]|uniref:Uncharacterized protein n=1 Tax=Candidatus Hydrogenisulfobacillus filiaventi TaxID=2707344 RepID=A0A6F8ZDZ8_9FIRM|nr:conserved membrane protein of unknown function [Candidatus Hydrogenisulfobacillus filiaventi]
MAVVAAVPRQGWPWRPWAAHLVLLLAASLWPYPEVPAAVARASENFAGQAWGWLRWDALWYWHLARHGYSPHDPSTAFFPLLPWLLRPFPDALTALVAVQGLFLLTLRQWQRFLADLAVPPAVASAAVWSLALGPDAIFFSSLYTEGLTLFLVLTALRYGLAGRSGYAAIAGGLAALSYPAGLLAGAWPLTLAVAALADRDGRRLGRALGWGLGVLGGFLVYPLWLWTRFGQPLLFLHAQAAWALERVWPWAQWPALLQLAERYPPGRIAPLLLSGTGSLLFLAALVPLARAMRPWPGWLRAGTWLYAGLATLSALSLEAQHVPFFSTLRWLGDLFPFYLGMGQWAGGSRCRTGLVLGVMAVMGGAGAVWFSHGWWYQ